jgi:pyruvate, orthophosphate dikinase
MPGMMDTVLNIGLNDESSGPGARQATSGSPGTPTAGCPDVRQDRARGARAAVRDALDGRKHAKGTTSDLDLDADDLGRWSTRTRRSSPSTPATTFPQDPRTQLDMAIRAVFDSWNTERAVLYRRQERIPADLGTAVNVMPMVFGNLGDSGTGVAFTRDPATGAQGVYGDYLEERPG